MGLVQQIVDLKNIKGKSKSEKVNVIEIEISVTFVVSKLFQITNEGMSTFLWKPVESVNLRRSTDFCWIAHDGRSAFAEQVLLKCTPGYRLLQEFLGHQSR